MSKKPAAPPEKLQAPTEVIEAKDDLKKLIISSLQDIMPPSQAKQAAERVTSKAGRLILSMTKMHSGPMPTPEFADGYERVLPGSTERMFRMAEKDQDAFIQSHENKQRRDHAFRITALLAGVIALCLILGVAILFAFWGMEWLAGSVVAMGAGGIIATLVNAASPIKPQKPKSEDRSGK